MKKQDQISFASTRAAMQKFKIVMVGDQNSGKSSIIIRYVKNDFDRTSNPTIGIDFTSKNISMEGRTIRLQLWDTAGQQRFRSLIPSYLKDCNLAIVVFDVTNASAADNLQKWIDFVKEARGNEAQICITGNKIDLETEIEKQVVEKIKSMASEQSIKYFEVSALTGDNINQMFDQLTEDMIKGNSNNSTSEIKSQNLKETTTNSQTLSTQSQKHVQSQPISLRSNNVQQPQQQVGTCC